ILSSGGGLDFAHRFFLDPPLFAVRNDEVIVVRLPGERQHLSAADGGNDLVAGLNLCRLGRDLHVCLLDRRGLFGRERGALARVFLGGGRSVVLGRGGAGGRAGGEKGG